MPGPVAGFWVVVGTLEGVWLGLPVPELPQLEVLCGFPTPLHQPKWFPFAKTDVPVSKANVRADMKNLMVSPTFGDSKVNGRIA